jgi:hypothetical protein
MAYLPPRWETVVFTDQPKIRRFYDFMPYTTLGYNSLKFSDWPLEEMSYQGLRIENFQCITDFEHALTVAEYPSISVKLAESNRGFAWKTWELSFLKSFTNKEFKNGFKKSTQQWKQERLSRQDILEKQRALITDYDNLKGLLYTSPNPLQTLADFREMWAPSLIDTQEIPVP